MISPETIAAYAPFGNAQLAFDVSNSVLTQDEETGNMVPGVDRIEYLASLTISSPDWQKQTGVDETIYSCNGRLLEPQELDPRITNGSQATAVINGYVGRLELVFDLQAFYNPQIDSVRQRLQGRFRVIGRGPHAPA